MELFGQLIFGFEQALTLQNVAFCFLGALFGTLVGVLPGLGPVATIAMLLPITFSLPPVAALIMLAGLYYSAQYGGSTTAILVNIPGESSAVVTCLDGHAMARRGRAGAALAVAALGSFFAAGTSGPAGAMVANLTPSSIRATAFGTLTFFNSVLGLAAGPVVIGALADRMGLEAALQVMPLVSVPVIVALLIGRKAYPSSLRRAEAVAAA